MKLITVVLLIAFNGSATTFADENSSEWVEAQIADALTAAPAAVTATAKIYAFNESGDQILVRDGDGPYTCVASGSNSLRVGKPAFPYPDPLCADQNAWAFFEAAWAQDNPLNPTKPLPTTPGMVWMLAGMNISSGGITYGKEGEGVVGIMGDMGDQDHVQMSPHIMILPLPVDSGKTTLPAKYNPDSSETTWVMAAGTSLAHVHVHFTEKTRDALLRVSD